MYKYVIKRILMMIPVLIGVSFLVFFILAVSPGDPTRMILGQQASQESIEAMRQELGLVTTCLSGISTIWQMLCREILGSPGRRNWRFYLRCSATSLIR